MTEAASIQFSEDAVAAALDLQEKNAHYRDRPLRVYLDGKGCDGFEYGISFDRHEPRDATFQFGSLAVVIDPDTLQFVQGSTVIWVDDERGQGFLVENPSHKKYRGKFYKRKVWQDKLQEKLRQNSGESHDSRH